MMIRTAGWQFFIRSRNIISDHSSGPSSPTPPDFSEPVPFVPPSPPCHDTIAQCHHQYDKSRSKNAYRSYNGTILHVPWHMHSRFKRTAGRLFLPKFSCSDRYPVQWLYSCANHPPNNNESLPFDLSFSNSNTTKSNEILTRSLTVSRYPDIDHRRCESWNAERQRHFFSQIYPWEVQSRIHANPLGIWLHIRSNTPAVLQTFTIHTFMVMERYTRSLWIKGWEVSSVTIETAGYLFMTQLSTCEIFSYQWLFSWRKDPPFDKDALPIFFLNPQGVTAWVIKN